MPRQVTCEVLGEAGEKEDREELQRDLTKVSEWGRWEEIEFNG